MGNTLPFIVPVVMLRTHLTDIADGSIHHGVHGHAEVVVCASGNGPLARMVNTFMPNHYCPKFAAASQRDNVIEAGRFENFLPAIDRQGYALEKFEFAPAMDPMAVRGAADTGS